MTTPHYTIIQLREATPQIAAQLTSLITHLTDAPQAKMGEERLRAIVGDPSTALLVASGKDGDIVGMLTIAHLTLPTSEKLWIEDVVVSPVVRGCGIGRRLVEAAIEWGSVHYPAATIYLTSNPSRIAARELYRSLGFEEYNTGVFRYNNQ